MRRAASAALVLVAGLLLAACASYDSAQVEDTIETDVSKQTQELTGSKIKSAECPAEVEPKEGGTFECEATLQSGKKLKLPYVFANDEGDYRLDVSPEQLQNLVGSG